MQIQPSYWSQIKGRSRQIGERLARQFEQLSHKPMGWMDQEHRAQPAGAPGTPEPLPGLPQDDDERFIVGLVLTYYRRHPQRARTRLLDLLGEVLTPGAPAATPAPQAPAAPRAPLAPGVIRPARAPAAPPVDEAVDAWRKLQQGVAPLKSKKR